MTIPASPSTRIQAKLIQLCFVVEDLEAAMADHSRIFGAGPWFLYKEPPAHLDRTLYRGRPTPMGTRVALGYAGDMMYELACPRPEMPSIFREVVDRQGYGLHHLGFGVRDFDAVAETLRSDGLESLHYGVTPRGARCVMVRREGAPHAIEEYIELLPASDAFYAFMRTCAAEWDGRSLVYDQPAPSDVILS
ncbi:VOC family protein [Sphingomonas naphthae]|uniref:VOC family protein n=1 Tax=Sphingomonas naphthae TaxID=1813468 RepID=A0ABY7TMR3_9SPHN|nr:VOC family protein [Sphingomonas naphthae]WCT74521.1 VOC family protein [Sphingomonas naphthae]